MDLYQKAIIEFHALFRKVMRSDMKEPTSVALATVGKGGQPTVRMVLLKHVDDLGFVFYTNKKSRKAQQLKKIPKAALCFYWPHLDCQVLVEGPVTGVGKKEADEYWATRPRESQLGGWASLQSSKLDQRSTLINRYHEMNLKFKKGIIPRPPHWSGYRLAPNRIEFWKAGRHRLHDRTVYEKVRNKWTVGKLFP